LVAPVVITVLAFLHIASAIGWMGGAVLFVSAISPGLRSLSPAASVEFVAKVGTRAIRFFAGAATATVIFGLALFASMRGSLGGYVDYGVAFGLLAYVAGVATFVYLRRAGLLAKQIVAEGKAGPPTPEYMEAIRTGGMSGAVSVLLLVLALIFMVLSGYPV
jgi:hypothetical protein